MKRILITGASGFVGAHLCRVLSRSYRTTALSFSTSLNLMDVQTVWGDLCSERTVRNLKQYEFDYIVHVAAKIRSNRSFSQEGLSPSECAQIENIKMMEKVIEIGRPVVFLSSTAVHWDIEHPYVLGRRKEEAMLQESGLPFVIVRPCAPYGPPLLFHNPKHTESFASLVSLIRYAPILPMLGGGEAYRQPIHVEDLARLVERCMEDGVLQGKVFDAAGAQAYRFSEIVSILSKMLNKRVHIVSIPKSVLFYGARLLPNFEPGLLAAMDQSECFDVTEIEKLVSLRSFEQGACDLLTIR
ncbi:MAG: hypothetical protein CMK59_09255 [Proteobacteria bacterium]|nr:hypothetical protein [Pseudomonadota bacterium]